MRALVCGGRGFSDYKWLSEVLSSFGGVTIGGRITHVIHGDARGADQLAGRWAHSVGAQVSEFSADWLTYGKAAGPIRNRQMLVEGTPKVVIAFPGGAGTANMVKQAREVGIAVVCPKK